MANIAYTHGRTDITPATIIGRKGDFVSEEDIANGTNANLGAIKWGEVAGRIGLSRAVNRVRGQTLPLTDYNSLNQEGSTKRFIGLEVRFREIGNARHWVGLVEPVTANDGTQCYVVSATSDSDTDPDNIRFDTVWNGWKRENGKILIPIGNIITGYVVFDVP